MNNLVLHPLTSQQLDGYTAEPTQVVILAGSAGSGKLSMAHQLAETILQLPAGKLIDYPYSLIVSLPADKKQIAIEAVRELAQFLTLKVPLAMTYNRAVIIHDAHLLSIEAQNALLKTLEEPPAGTILILTVDYEQALLPTIRSRAQTITIKRPLAADLKSYFIEQNYDKELINRAYTISGGLPGLMSALLNEAAHPLLLATEKARLLLSQTSYQRLLAVDELAKQAAFLRDMLFILQQMSHVSLQTATGAVAQKWQQVMASSYQAAEDLNNSAQAKLVLTNLMLSL